MSFLTYWLQDWTPDIKNNETARFILSTRLKEARECSTRGAPQLTAEMRTQLHELMKSDRTAPKNVDGGEKREQDCQQQRGRLEGKN